MIVRPGVPGEVDAQVHAFVDAHRDPALTTFFVGYTGLGRWFVLALAAAAVMVARSATARRREAVFLLVCMTASLLLNTVLKYVFARARPPAEAAVVHARGYAFPSGHAMSSATLALALVVVAWPTRWRLPVVALAAVFALLMGISRIYLGVHWLTDVLAGWCMAVAVVTGTQLGMGIVEDVRARGSQSRDAERDAARVERTRRHMAVAFLALMTASIVFAALVAAHAGRGLDGRVLDWAQAHPSGWIHSLSEVVGVLGSWPVLGPLTLAVAALFWLRRRRRDAEYFFATMFVSTLLDVTLKLLIRRPPIAGSEGCRPALPLLVPERTRDGSHRFRGGAGDHRLAHALALARGRRRRGLRARRGSLARLRRRPLAVRRGSRMGAGDRGGSGHAHRPAGDARGPGAGAGRAGAA